MFACPLFALLLPSPHTHLALFARKCRKQHICAFPMHESRPASVRRRTDRSDKSKKKKESVLSEIDYRREKSKPG
ncbi:hypothetical protein DFJ73DRAFT_836416 [Zopfochytrium polystomum]|nr:hypothetical protein DFJ73DRAFT_836416 [Zopfochytrium polystomum]